MRHIYTFMKNIFKSVNTFFLSKWYPNSQCHLPFNDISEKSLKLANFLYFTSSLGIQLSFHLVAREFMNGLFYRNCAWGGWGWSGSGPYIILLKKKVKRSTILNTKCKNKEMNPLHWYLLNFIFVEVFSVYNLNLLY